MSTTDADGSAASSDLTQDDDTIPAEVPSTGPSPGPQDASSDMAAPSVEMADAPQATSVTGEHTKPPDVSNFSDTAPAPLPEGQGISAGTPEVAPPSNVEQVASSRQADEKQGFSDRESIPDSEEDVAVGGADGTRASGTITSIEDVSNDSAEGPVGGLVDKEDEDEPTEKNFGFVFDSGMVTYVFVLAGIALCMCPFAAWKCFSKSKKVLSTQYVHPPVQVIRTDTAK